MRHPSAFVADCHLIDEPTRELELGTYLGQPLTSGFSCTNAERAQVQAVIARSDGSRAQARGGNSSRAGAA